MSRQGAAERCRSAITVKVGYSVIDRNGVVRHTSPDIYECFDLMRGLAKASLYRNHDKVMLAFTTGPQGGGEYRGPDYE